MRRWLRWLLLLALVAGVVWAVRNHREFLTNGAHALREANPAGVATAALCSLACLFAMAEVMRHILGAGQVRVARCRTMSLTLAANAWSVTLPAGAAIATVLQFTTMRRWGASTILTSLFVALSGAISTMWLIALGVLAMVFLGASFSLWSILGSLALMGALALLLYWLARHPQALARLVRRVLPRGGFADMVLSHIEQLTAVRLTPWQFARISMWSLANRLLELAALAVSVWAVTGWFPWSSHELNHATFAGVLLAFVTAKIVGTAQFTPGGVGPIEGALIATLVASGMTAAEAFAAVVVYRMITLVAAAALGWVVYAASEYPRTAAAPASE